MCGRYVVWTSEEEIERRFGANFEQPFSKTDNASPSESLPVILNSDPQAIKLVHWGIAPIWLPLVTGKRELINVRAETLRDKKTFKKDFILRRCLVVADKFYEWKAVGSKKVPYQFALSTEEPFAFAGIWDVLPSGMIGFAIITTTPNPTVAEVHDRMPVILTPDNEKHWLRDEEKPADLLDLLKPWPTELVAKQVGPTMGKGKRPQGMF
jgi:putative SOS response-associated peptidase YedK